LAWNSVEDGKTEICLAEVWALGVKSSSLVGQHKWGHICCIIRWWSSETQPCFSVILNARTSLRLLITVNKCWSGQWCYRHSLKEAFSFQIIWEPQGRGKGVLMWGLWEHLSFLLSVFRMQWDILRCMYVVKWLLQPSKLAYPFLHVVTCVCKST
jgi:hypothetical protein